MTNSANAGLGLIFSSVLARPHNPRTDTAEPSAAACIFIYLIVPTFCTTTTTLVCRYASTEYAIVSGVRKGTILARNPNEVAHVQTLGKSNFEERFDYILVTNFDFFWHDIREWFGE